MKKILAITALGALLLASSAQGKEVDIATSWNFNDEAVIDGFKIYAQKVNDDKFSLVKKLVGAEHRSWKGKIDLPVGDNMFVCTAYVNSEHGYRESRHSNSVVVNPEAISVIPTEFTVTIIFSGIITVK